MISLQRTWGIAGGKDVQAGMWILGLGSLKLLWITIIIMSLPLSLIQSSYEDTKDVITRQVVRTSRQVGVRICWAGRSRTRRAEPGSSIRRRGRFSLRLPLHQLLPQVSTANSGNWRKTSLLFLSVSLLPLQILQSANCLNKSKREVTSSFSSNCWWI